MQTKTKTPHVPDENRPFVLNPNNASDEYYDARTNRNQGWITAEEQSFLKTKTIGIAGCGGMGGLLASIFFRLGIGEVRIADCEVFDTSNINRQFAAGRYTIGKSKALETARMTRDVTDDGTLMVFPEGIEEHSVDTFLEGCDLICDEIEFWAVGARILLHQRARSWDIPVFNCNSVGFGTRLFLFRPDGISMESCLGLTYADAQVLQSRIQEKTAKKSEIKTVMKRMLASLIPEVPEYSPDDPTYRTESACIGRLLDESTAPIIATNPPMAAGFLANHVLLELLRDSPVQRAIPVPPPVPGYLYFDTAFMQAKIVERNTCNE